MKNSKIKRKKKTLKLMYKNLEDPYIIIIITIILFVWAE